MKRAFLLVAVLAVLAFSLSGCFITMARLEKPFHRGATVIVLAEGETLADAVEHKDWIEDWSVFGATHVVIQSIPPEKEPKEYPALDALKAWWNKIKKQKTLGE